MNITEFFNLDSDDSEMSNLQDVLLDSLKDLYSAETQLVKALPKMEKGAKSPKLKQAIRSHLAETKIHVERLEEIGKIIGKKLSGKTCKAMQGLIKEGDEALEHESENGALVDAMIIGAAQRVEHYEMAGYGTARAFAEQLGQSRVVKLLQQTLNEEGAADKKLTQVCQQEVLPRAFKSAMSEMQKNGREIANGSSMNMRRTASRNVPMASKRGRSSNGRSARI